MARLVVQPGSPAAWEIKLKEGANSLGRNPANDFRLDDPSVSGSHCQVAVENGHAVIRDLGSTNGTYVNRAPVKEAVLQPGQTIHLGGVELMFYSDAPAPAVAAPPAVTARPAPGAPPLPPPRAAIPAVVARIPNLPATAPGPVRPPAPIAAPPVVAAPSSAVGSGPCKHHPKTQGRYFCGQCQQFFCELCVTARGLQKLCRYCGAQCVPVQVQLQRPAATKGFFARFPSAFVYPFRGSGLLVLIVYMLIMAAMDYIGRSIFFLFVAVAAYGYLFSFMQGIIHSTANGEDQMPDLPGFDDVFGGAFRLGVTVLICFALPIAFVVLERFGVFDPSPSALIVTMLLGCLYFPMAFLAVAMKDTALAANPLIVIPAIVKVPLGYLLTTIVVISLFALRLYGYFSTHFARAETYHTRHMSVLFESFALRAVWSLASVYLLTVAMRTLGLLYVTNKQKFGWYNR